MMHNGHCFSTCSKRSDMDTVSVSTQILFSVSTTSNFNHILNNTMSINNESQTSNHSNCNNKKVVICTSIGVLGFLSFKMFFAKVRRSNHKQQDEFQSQFGLTHLFDYHHRDNSSVELKLPPNMLLVTDLDHTLIGQPDNEDKQQCIKKIHVCTHVNSIILQCKTMSCWNNI